MLPEVVSSILQFMLRNQCMPTVETCYEEVDSGICQLNVCSQSSAHALQSIVT